jgi:Flagellar biosynthesis protein, FliO
MSGRKRARAELCVLHGASSLTEHQLRGMMSRSSKREQCAPPPAKNLRSVWVNLCRTLKQCVKPVLKQRRDRKLELLEVQQLGEKRFVAIVRVDKQQYLIGGGAASVLLLAELGAGATRVLSPRPFSQESA